MSWKNGIESCIACLLLTFWAVQAFAFETSDLQGQWYWCGLASGDASAGDAPRWEYGTIAFDNGGNGTIDGTTTDGSFSGSDTLELDDDGILTRSGRNEVNGFVNDDVNLFAFNTTDNGYVLRMGVKRNPDTTFTTADMAGQWYWCGMTSGDAASGDEPRWEYGLATIDSGGIASVDVTTPSGSTTVAASYALDANGVLTSPASASVHGYINEAKNVVFFIEEEDGYCLRVAVKRSPAAIFNLSDSAGRWEFCELESGDLPAGSPGWAYGWANVDAAGNVDVNYTSPDGTDTGTDTIEMDENGIITNPATYDTLIGFINDSKDMAIVTDTRPNAGGVIRIHAIRSTSGDEGSGSAGGGGGGGGCFISAIH